MPGGHRLHDQLGNKRLQSKGRIRVSCVVLFIPHEELQIGLRRGTLNGKSGRLEIILPQAHQLEIALVLCSSHSSLHAYVGAYRNKHMWTHVYMGAYIYIFV